MLDAGTGRWTEELSKSPLSLICWFYEKYEPLLTMGHHVPLRVHLSRKSYGHGSPLLARSSKLLNAFP